MTLNFFLWFCVAALLGPAVSLVFAQENIFVYDAHGKRDPFAPLVSAGGTLISYESDLGPSDMALQGIMADANGNNLAIINGKVVKAADRVGAYEVESIDKDQVQLRKDQEQFSLRLKKGDF